MSSTMMLNLSLKFKNKLLNLKELLTLKTKLLSLLYLLELNKV